MESKLVVTIVTIILFFCFVSIVVFRPSRYKPMVLLLLPVIIVCIVYIFTRKPNYNHAKTAQYRQPEQEKVNKYIRENLSPSQGLKIGFVYITYHDLDSIPQDVMENIKKYCRGYYINFYRLNIFFAIFILSNWILYFFPYSKANFLFTSEGIEGI